jgi:hypothetical protein
MLAACDGVDSEVVELSDDVVSRRVLRIRPEKRCSDGDERGTDVVGFEVGL